MERPRKPLLPVSPSTQQRSSAIEERDANAPTPEDAPGDVEPVVSNPAQAPAAVIENPFENLTDDQMDTLRHILRFEALA